MRALRTPCAPSPTASPNPSRPFSERCNKLNTVVWGEEGGEGREERAVGAIALGGTLQGAVGARPISDRSRFEDLTEVFDPGRPPKCPPGRPWGT